MKSLLRGKCQARPVAERSGRNRQHRRGMFEKLPAVPLTGAESTSLLWSVIAAMSIAGMALLTSKRKKA